MTRLLRPKDLMQIYGVGRKTVTIWLNAKGCPVFPRVKGGRYLVPEDEFDRWLRGSYLKRK